MDATANLSLRFAPSIRIEGRKHRLGTQPASASEGRDSNEPGQRSYGPLGLWDTDIVNRHQGDLNGLAGGSSVAMIGGISAVLVASVFLVAACLHWRFCVRHPVELPVRCHVRPFHFR